MSYSHQQTMADRLDAAAQARDAMRARFRDRPAADDPAVLAKQAERQAIVADREKREAERAALRQAEAERVAAAAAAAIEAEQLRKADEIAAAAERVRAEQSRQKEERDARYAARKAKARR